MRSLQVLPLLAVAAVFGFTGWVLLTTTQGPENAPAAVVLLCGAAYTGLTGWSGRHGDPPGREAEHLDGLLDDSAFGTRLARRDRWWR